AGRSPDRVLGRHLGEGEDQRRDGVDRARRGDRGHRRGGVGVSDLVHSLESLPPGPLYALIATFAALENIFPPVPADTVVALGAFLAGRGTLDPWAVLCLTWTATAGSAAAVHFARHRLCPPFVQGYCWLRLPLW